MDRRDLESGCRLHSAFAWLHQLLCDANGCAPRCYGYEEVPGLTRKSGRRAVWTGKVRLDREALVVPTKWRKPRRIFVNSMSDLFHDSVPADFVAEVWSVMASTPW